MPEKRKVIRLIDKNHPEDSIFHTVDAIEPPGYVMDGTPWGPVEVCRYEPFSGSTYDGDLYVVPAPAPEART